MVFELFNPWINVIISMAGYGLTLIGAAVIIYGSIKAFYVFALTEFSSSSELSTAKIRLVLGAKISVALEFLLAGDLLVTVMAPSWDEIGKLAALVVIRTALSYYLHWETSRDQGITAKKR